jgi:SAM-dependent methyltransferase
VSAYEARGYYQDPQVAERYDEQFRHPRGLRELRARVFGRCEERAFRSLLAGVPRGGTVLDVACGTGRYVGMLLHHGYQVVGSDISAEMLEVARRANGSHPRLLAFEQADAARLPFEDGRFDGVTCMRLYHRVPPETRLEMLREVRRVGRGWGILFFGMTNPWLAMRRALRRVGGGRPSDPHPLTMRRLESDLDRVGLTLRDRRWVLPGLADALVARVSWRSADGLFSRGPFDRSSAAASP